MWYTDTIWLELAILNFLSALGSMLLGHFERRSGRARMKQVLKLVVANVITVLLSAYGGRAWVFAFFCVMALAVLYIHVIWLPGKGVNGWTAEPREKYFRLRGWGMDTEKGDFG